MMNREQKKQDKQGKEKNMARKLAHFKDISHLPELSREVSKKLLDAMHRGDERTRTIVHEEMERTVPDKIAGETAVCSAEGKEMEEGIEIRLLRKVRNDGEVKGIIERFIIERKLSSERNIAGDVWLAKRYWGGDFYGDVVLKTPKYEHSGSSARARAHLYRDIQKEKRNLLRFGDHPNVLSPSGEEFEYNHEPVIQMEYQPWSISDYLFYFREEHELTAALMSTGMQCLDAIAYMGDLRDEEGPLGWVHVDFKRAHMRLDHKENEGWVVTIIDLDSVIPAGPRELRGMVKYNRECVDPEKFMKLHNADMGFTAEPSETVYSLGLSLMYAMASRFGIRLIKRRFAPTTKKDEKYIWLPKQELGKKIEETRSIDEVNLLKIYYTNKFRRISAGKFDQDPEEMRDLVEKYDDVAEVRHDALEELGDADEDATVHPYVLAGIRECLKPYSSRFDAKTMQGIFEKLWEDYLKTA